MSKALSRAAQATPTRLIGVIVMLIAVFIGVVGFMSEHMGLNLPNLVSDFLSDFYSNISVDFASIAIVVLIIDALNERREQRRTMARLIREVGSPDNGIALRAVEELKADDSIREGMLRGAILYGANLERAKLQGADLANAQLDDAILKGADLRWADLSGATIRWADLRNTRFFGADLTSAFLLESDLRKSELHGAELSAAYLTDSDLTGCKISDKQLMTCAGLAEATMPKGSKYDGRFNLPGDIWAASETENDLANFQDIASYFDIDLPDYIRGQEWALENGLAPWLTKSTTGQLVFKFPSVNLLRLAGRIRSILNLRIWIGPLVVVVTSKTRISGKIDLDRFAKAEVIRVRDDSNVYVAKSISVE